MRKRSTTSACLGMLASLLMGGSAIGSVIATPLGTEGRIYLYGTGLDSSLEGNSEFGGGTFAYNQDTFSLFATETSVSYDAVWDEDSGEYRPAAWTATGSIRNDYGTLGVTHSNVLAAPTDSNSVPDGYSWVIHRDEILLR